jgi:ferredoxin
MKNSSDTFGNRTGDLPTCSASTNCATACPHTFIRQSQVMEIKNTQGGADENLDIFAHQVRSTDK